MDFDLTEEQRAIRDAVARICARFDDGYWLERERTGTFPDDFAAEIARGGFYGVTMPEQYGGSGLGITEASLVMQEIGRYGAAASSSVHINIFGLQPVVGLRHPRAEGANAAAADPGRAPHLLWRHRAGCGPRHHAYLDLRAPPRGRGSMW